MQLSIQKQLQDANLPEQGTSDWAKIQKEEV